MIIALIKDFPPINAKIDSPTFAKILIALMSHNDYAQEENIDSSASPDIVVSEPQNPTGNKIENIFPSRCHC